MRKVDRATVKALELTAPGACKADRDALYGQLKSGTIFGAFHEGDREEIWSNVLSVSTNRLIPSLFSFFQDVHYLEEPANCVKMLVKLSSRDTVSSALEDAFKDVNQTPGQCVIQESELRFVSKSGSRLDRLDSGCRQVWMSAFRNYLKMPTLPKGKNLLAKPRSKPSSAATYDFAALAYRLGFESKQIQDLLQRPADWQIARNTLLEARDPEYYSYDPSDLDRCMELIVSCFETAKRRPEAEVQNAEINYARPKRCGIPEQQTERLLLFLDTLDSNDEGQDCEITPFFIRRSVYFAFFGKPYTISGHVAGRQAEEERLAEQMRLEQERREQERREQERQEGLEQERQAAEEQAMRQSAEKNRAKEEEKKRVEEKERERIQKKERLRTAEKEERRRKARQGILEKAKEERLKQKRVYQEKLGQERLEQERQKTLEQERLEQERLDQQRLQQERLEEERVEQERQERLEQERQERLEQERLEQERLEKERLNEEKQEQEEREQENIYRQSEQELFEEDNAGETPVLDEQESYASKVQNPIVGLEHNNEQLQELWKTHSRKKGPLDTPKPPAATRNRKRITKLDLGTVLETKAQAKDNLLTTVAAAAEVQLHNQATVQVEFKIEEEGTWRVDQTVNVDPSDMWRLKRAAFKYMSKVNNMELFDVNHRMLNLSTIECIIADGTNTILLVPKQAPLVNKAPDSGGYRMKFRRTE